jgi:hypothetical protein
MMLLYIRVAAHAHKHEHKFWSYFSRGYPSYFVHSITITTDNVHAQNMEASHEMLVKKRKQERNTH